MVTKARQREQTRALILGLAERAFAERGYAGVALEDLVADAGLTRGALYHHFGSKAALFGAVLEHAQGEVARAVELAAGADADPLTSFLAGCRAFLEASFAPGVRRILLVDGPAVLGWDDWRAGDLESSARLLDEGVAELAAAGIIAPERLRTVATMISGALNEVAVAGAAASPDGTAEIDAAIETLARMIAGLAPDDGE
ncbi:TetR/AcrR family transcriptional regulator [Agromyces subbeticus]|uniref:TetR/AcrR family transcriptional regulator n=1 Tax=Agromyces subbeticus TaxID=293890 RepID=UPI0003B47C8D|nr:TetR/AcrR family transcriptional regulator [Agromyces subbeticus]